MKNYWSCTKFADWIRGTKNPLTYTSEEWNAREKRARIKKIRYWFAEDGLDYLQNIILSPVTLFNVIQRYIHHRWIVKSHALTSNLERGTYHEFDDRLLYATFDAFSDFVETEYALEFFISEAEDRKKYKKPWYRKFFRLGIWRCPDAAIDYLNWASKLTNNEEWVDKNDPSCGKPTSQALAAQEILVLYRWWKIDRPKRPDPHAESGSQKNCDEKYDDEDTQMLIRLIKIRHGLWT